MTITELYDSLKWPELRGWVTVCIYTDNNTFSYPNIKLWVYCKYCIIKSTIWEILIELNFFLKWRVILYVGYEWVLSFLGFKNLFQKRNNRT